MKHFYTITALFILLCLPCAAETTAEIEMTDDEQTLFSLINEQRIKSKLPPLIFDAEILQDCREWAEQLHRERRLYHWHGGKENCARGYTTPRSAFLGWRSSQGHNAFLHNRVIKYAAVAEYGNYWVFRGATDKEEYRERKERKIR